MKNEALTNLLVRTNRVKDMQVKSNERPTVQLLIMTDIDNHSGLASSAASTFSHYLLAKEITYSNRKLN